MDFESVTLWVTLIGGGLLLLLERLPSTKTAPAPVQTRWLTNIGLMLLAGIAAGLIFPGSVIAAARINDQGLLHKLQLPLLLEVIVVFLFIDFWRYWEHRVFHEVPLLWRLHLVHHSDTAMDVTTGQRHHPLEAMLTTPLMFILLFSLGFSAAALGVYFLIATASSLYTHTSLALPTPADKLLSPWVVTPSVHAVHHSAYQPETDSNYGAVLSVWDRLFGTWVDPAITTVETIGLEQFRHPQDTTLAAALIQPLEYKPRYCPSDSAIDALETGSGTTGRAVNLDTSSAAATSVSLLFSPAWRSALITGGIGLVLVIAAMWPAAIDLASVWSEVEAYRYAWLVLPTFVYLAGWYHRDAILALRPRPGYSGLMIALLASAVWLAASLASINLGQQLALVLAIQAVMLCTLGWVCYRKLMPLMLLLFLMVPCGDVIEPLLRQLTVKWIEWFCLLVSFPIDVEGFTIKVGEMSYVVVDECSGLSMFTLSGFLGYSFGLMLFRSFSKVLALAAASAAVGILSNAVRVCVIVTIDVLRGSQMSLDDHQNVQLPILIITLAIVLYLANRLKHETWSVAPDDTGLKTGGASYRHYTPVIAGLLVMVCVAVAHRQTNKPFENPYLTASLARIASLHPESQWIGNGSPSANILELPLNDERGTLVVAGHSGSTQLPREMLEPKDTHLWRHAATRRYQECSMGRCVNYVHLMWNRKGGDNQRHAFYTYFIGTHTTESKLGFRLLNGWQRLTGSDSEAGIIGFRLDGDVPDTLSLSRTIEEFKLLPSAAS